MLLRLALAMHEPDIDAFSHRITLRQLAIWWAFWRVEPWGNEWRRTSRLVGRVRQAFGQSFTEDDEDQFMPGYRPRVQTDDEIEAELMKIPQFAEQMRNRSR